MEKLLISSGPDSIYKPLKSGAVLDEDYEDPETLEEYKNSEDRVNVTEQTRTLHVYYIGDMPESFQKLSKKLLEFVESFYQIPVVFKGYLTAEHSSDPNKYIVHPIDNKDGYYAKIQERKACPGRLVYYKKKGKHKNNVIEFNAHDLVGVLGQYRENNSYTVLGITSHNIYNPHYKTDVIMGMARGNRGCVVSIVECFDMKIKDKEKREKAALFELIKTTAHELSHTFAIGHCVSYNCIMNSQYIKEDPIKDPIYFCADCIQKLYSAINFDCKSRWQKLLSFYINNGFKGCAKWIEKRLKLWDKDNKS